MQVLPEGFALPPAPYLLALAVGLGAVGWAFLRRRPAVTDRQVLALAPWMGVGACLHVLYVLDALPAAVRPLAGTPSVYLTVAVVAGATWLAADVAADGARLLAGVGTLALLAALSGALLVGAARGTLHPLWPGLGLVASLALAAVVWVGLTRARPGVAITGGAGALAVFAHVLDGVSTAVGIDVLGFGERTPLSKVIIDLAATLPTADLLGAGWLFVLVKVGVAAVVVALMADYVREEPTEGFLLLALVAAVGLGPGVHNLVLFSVA
ncbi:DUF63 family protein [Halegenticoccus tardaugens]|uniref:DUF63 family protein n=1 Tax=Halegenticoccus tardaugens TaxID=2071624 RepID=UPI00100B5DCB|nr:DUF63 family protein [Halegenticoccus tardaugens]